MIRMPKITLAFSTRLYLWTTLLILLTFGAMAMIYNHYSVKRAEAAGGRYVSMLINEMSHSINESLITVEGLVGRYEPIVSDNLENPDRLMPIVQRWVLSDPMVVGGRIAFEPNYYKSKGKYFMSYFTTGIGNKPVSKYLGSDDYNYFEMPWYKAAKESGKGTWSEPYYDDGGSDLLLITYSKPIYDHEGKMVGIIAADMSLDKLVEDLGNLSPYEGSYTFVLSRKGTFISHPKRLLIMNHTIYSYGDSIKNPGLAILGDEMLQGKSGWKHHDGSGDKDSRVGNVMVSYGPVKRTGWSVATVSPYDKVLSHLGTITAYTLMVLAVSLLALLIILRLVIKRSMRSLDQLTKVARDIAKGDFSAPLPDVSPRDSMAPLADALSQMQNSLSEYIANLTKSSITRTRIQSELDIAHAIQLEMQPETFSAINADDDLDVYAMIKTTSTINGDFYECVIDDDTFSFCIGSVASVGVVTTSLLMTAVKTVFRSSVAADQSPMDTIKAMNQVLRKKPESSMHTSVFVGSLNLKTGLLTYANATHNTPLVVTPGHAPEVLTSHTIASDRALPTMPESNSELQLPHGSRMLLFTDGVINAANAGGSAYTDYTLYHTLTIIMANHPDCSPQELIEMVDRSVEDHIGDHAQKLDRTLLAFLYK